MLWISQFWDLFTDIAHISNCDIIFIYHLCICRCDREIHEMIFIALKCIIYWCHYCDTSKMVFLLNASYKSINILTSMHIIKIITIILILWIFLHLYCCWESWAIIINQIDAFNQLRGCNRHYMKTTFIIYSFYYIIYRHTTKFQF